MICLLVGGPDVKINVGMTTFKFEDHPYLGPCPSRQLGERHPFWAAVSLWYEQGKQVDANGFAVWSARDARGKR